MDKIIKRIKRIFNIFLGFFSFFRRFQNADLQQQNRMSSQSAEKILSDRNAKSKEGSEEGKIYEILSLSLLAKRGYELSKKGDSKFCCFAIGREVDIGKEGKFDDVVFSYTDRDNTNSLIFVQIKHKKDDYQIDSEVLSAEASKAKGGGGGGMRRDFNLQKYFISFLDIREELKNPVSTKLRNGKIKNAVIFTNSGLNTEELSRNGFCLKKAPDDIINLFALKEAQESKIQELTNCYQIDDVSEDLRKIFKRSSDLHRLATELAQYVVWENYREKNILGIDESPVKHYHVALEREVVKKTEEDKKKSDVKKNGKAKQYCEAHFRGDFLDNDKSGSKLELRDALFEAVRELDGSKKAASDNELKKVLKEVKLKVVPNFGKSKHNIQTALPSQWLTVNDEDITDFLECLVFIVNQPRVKELESLFRKLNQESAIENASLRQILDQIENTGPKFRKRIEKVLGIEKSTKYKEKWISDEEIVNFIEEQNQLISISFFVTAMTLMYENDLIRYGKFKKFGKLKESIDRFLSSSSNKILLINTSVTLLSSIKVLQFLNTKKNCKAEDGRISVCMDMFNCKENRDSVLKAFQLESNNLLTIECRYYVKEQDFEELYGIAHDNPNKKIIIIVQQDVCSFLFEKCRTDYQKEEQYILEKDSIELKDFEPVEDPLKKEIVIFQGQDKKVSLATLTGFEDWQSYADYLDQDKILNKTQIADVMIEVLNNDGIEVGSRPPGTSSLEGAYAELFEEINSDTLLYKLLGNEDFENITGTKTLKGGNYAFSEEINRYGVARNLDNGDNEVYIFDGIKGSNKNEKLRKLGLYFGLENGQEMIGNLLGDIGSDSKIQIFDDENVGDQVKDENFKKVCYNNPNKKIFWIHIQDKENANLQQFYNPNFYLQRKFKNVIITKEVIEKLMKQNLSEIFIVYPVNNPEELIQSLNFTNINVTKQFLINYENGMILLCTQEDVEAIFKEPSSLIGQNETVHCLKLEEDKLIWCYSHGSLDTLRKYIDCEQNEIDLVAEDYLVRDVKDRKVVIIADDPGMGKTTTLTKLYESKAASESFIETHWILRINIKYHLQDIRDIKLVGDTIDVVDFLTKIDLKLNQNVAKSLLKFALHKNKSFSKPLLLVFDGFDEIVNIEDRNKMITLMKFLKNETAAKLWITTRLHYQEILENELSTFAFEFTPMDNRTKVEYIKNYLKNRLYLVLKSNIFAELFPNNGEMKENKRLRKYTKAFLSKIKSVFKENMFRFIGTPLQLYLMLEGSTRHFKVWTEKDLDENLDFDYLGNDILEIYETFIDRKFSIYFKKMGINESIPQEKDKYIFNQFIEDYAKSLILKSQPKYALEKFKDTVLSVGIIKSKGSNIEFIHTTFQDYFAAEVFMNWIKEASNIISNTSEREYILKEILKKPDFQLIRTFINLKLQIISEIGLLEESLKQYGKSIERLLMEEQSVFVDEEGTVLHVAIKERNTHIASFLLNSLKGKEDILKQFLFMRDKYGKTALHIACRGNYNKIFRILLDTAAGISEDTLQNFFSRLDENKWNALDEAVCKSKDVRILEELLKRANNKLDLIMNKKKKKSSLILACDVRKNDFFKTLVNEFKHDDNSLKQLILFKDVSSSCNVLYYAALKFRNIVEYLLQMTRSINDNNETLKHLILPGEGNLPLKRVIEKGNIAAFSIILNAAKNIHDDNYTLKQLLWNCVSQVSSLLVAEEKKCGIMKKLLKTAANLGKEILEKFIFDLIKKDKNVMHVIFENGNGNVFTDSFKILEEVQYKIMREKLFEMHNSIPLTDELNVDKKRLIEAIRRNQISKVKDILDRAKNSSNNPKEKLKILLSDVNNKEFSGNTLHMACLYGRTNIIKELISYAIEINDEGETLNELIASRNSRKKTPFQVLRNRHAEKIKQIIESLILEATKDNNHQVANILQKMNKKKDR